MKFEVQLASPSGTKSRTIELERVGRRWHITLDGQSVDADPVKIAPNTLSILLRGESHEIRVAPSSDGKLKVQTGLREFTAEIVDPRSWRGRHSSHIEMEGRQHVTAPMAGKVVRVLVKVGDQVEAGQGLLVVEAMKMQNEIRSTKSGVVEHLLVAGGQAVNSGEILAWIS